MDKWLKSTAGIGLAGLLVLYAAHGEKFIAALAASFEFLFALSAKSPLGVGAFVLAIAIAVAAQYFFGRFIVAPCAASRTAIIAAVGFVFGFGVMYVQLRTTNGFLLAMLAGFASPFIHQCAAAAVGLLRRDKATP